MQALASSAAAAAPPASQLSLLHPSPAQRCHPDPLSIALSFLHTADFARSSRACRQWLSASQRHTSWPQLGIDELARFPPVLPRCFTVDVQTDDDDPDTPSATTIGLLLSERSRDRVTALELCEFDQDSTARDCDFALTQASFLPLRYLSLCLPSVSSHSVAGCYRSLAPTLLVLELALPTPVMLQRLPLLTNLQALSLPLNADNVLLLPVAALSLQQLRSLKLVSMQAHVNHISKSEEKSAALRSLLTHPSLTLLQLSGLASGSVRRHLGGKRSTAAATALLARSIQCVAWSDPS